MRRLFLNTREISKWMKRTAVVSVVLFIVSLIGLLAGSTLPTNVEQEAALANYAHTGRFDYLVYLKPSYLFGPEPQEPPTLPPNPKYPTELIDSIDMIFRYETSFQLLEGVKIEAILENSEIWQKKIELVPVTNKTGNFNIEFELDLEEINELFDTIDEETQIRSSTRLVTIVATVGLGEGLESESLIQSLPITLSKSILEISSDRVKTVPDPAGGIAARGTFDYTIYLEENSLYNTETLKPPEFEPYIPPQPQAMEAGPVIPYQLVDRLDASYYYNLRSDRELREVNEEITVTATIENPEFWSKTLVLVPPTTESGNFKVDFPVDVDYLNELLGSIRDETAIPAETYNLVIKADVHVTAETDFGPIDEVFTQTLSSELGGGTLTWNEELLATQEGAITTTWIIPNPNRYLGLSVDGLRTTTAILSGIFLIFFLASLVLYNKFKPVEPPLFEKEALQVGKKYADRIAEATSQTPVPGEKIISLGSMEDLVKVADELGKPVIHQPPRASEKRHTYYVLDGTTQYQYIISPRSKERRSHV